MLFCIISLLTELLFPADGGFIFSGMIPWRVMHFIKERGKKDAEKMELIESCCEDMHRSCDRCHSGTDCAGDDLDRCAGQTLCGSAESDRAGPGLRPGLLLPGQCKGRRYGKVPHGHFPVSVQYTLCGNRCRAGQFYSSCYDQVDRLECSRRLYCSRQHV